MLNFLARMCSTPLLDISPKLGYFSAMSKENFALVNSFMEVIESATEYNNSNSTEGFFKTVEFAKSFKFLVYSLIPFVFFYVFGFFYNNLQNPNNLFSSAWFFDSFILSWTNLFILPILILLITYGIFRKIDWKSDFWLVAFVHLLSPLLWIIGYLILRFSVKTIEAFTSLISEILKYLAA